MCWTIRTKKKKKKKKRFQPNKVVPVSFTMDEMIMCHGCSDKHPVEDIQIHCAGCNQFYHCCIAGTCYGTECEMKDRKGNVHKSVWCIKCVPIAKINQEKYSREELCVCYQCAIDYPVILS